MILPLFSVAALLWFAGYLSVKGIIPHKKVPMSELDKIVIPPKWLYYLCGAPKSDKYHPGAITVGALRAQIAGIAFGIFTIWLNIWPTRTNLLIGLGLCVLTPYLITLWISKNRKFDYRKKKASRQT